MKKPLSEDLQSSKLSLHEFAEVTQRVLHHIENVITSHNEVKGYIIYESSSAGSIKYMRPVNGKLFLFDSQGFREEFETFMKILYDLKNGKRVLKSDEYRVIDVTVYTIQQAIGIGLDLLSNPNSSRKHMGNRFEELIRLVIKELGITNKKVVLNIPYSDDKKNVYKCETDLIFSPFKEVKSNSRHIEQSEVVVSLKTSSKDRLGKIFIDKLLMERFVKHDVKVVGIFLNDVQRKETKNISYTFVSG
ncbi:MAG: hypothetical protein GY950_23025, partial [bacterium]|nr:hypothetical protein [bacterium]